MSPAIHLLLCLSARATSSKLGEDSTSIQFRGGGGVAKPVFFTVTARGKGQLSKKVLDQLAKKFEARTLELKQFNQRQDAEEIKEYTALVDRPRSRMNREWLGVSRSIKGLPVWAQLAKKIILVGGTVEKSPEKALHCAARIFWNSSKRNVSLFPERKPKSTK